MNKYCSMSQLKLHINKIRDIWLNLKVHLEDPTIKQYLLILDINPNNLVDTHSNEYFLESKKMIKVFLETPITNSIFHYLEYKSSKIKFLNLFSDEQIKYITSINTHNTKLLACAGSGKTRSIIGRIRFMVEHGLAFKEDVYMVTFSHHAAADFRRKVIELFPDHKNFCKMQNFSTIDALAKSVLCKVRAHQSNNVEILSIAFRNYLRDIQKGSKFIKPIKHLFIDEAQDINDVQHEIFTLLAEKFSTKLHLIGDPNQNIYQFRRSSSSYLMHFQAQQFELTLNFRSTQQIIEFSEFIKPINTTPSKSGKDLQGPLVNIINYPVTSMHEFILDFISKYEKDLSNIAIICPTKGIGNYSNVGLSVIFNLLKSNNISINQLYDESGQYIDKKKEFVKIPKHINLLTYHGTKGLEFDVVFVMDFYYHLFNIRPTEEEHDINRYLLYVATSRAINLMYICTYTNIHEGFINYWITYVPPDKYIEVSPINIPMLAYRQKGEKPTINGITELINELSDEQLFLINDCLSILDENVLTRRIFRDFSHIKRGNDEPLFGIFCEELLYLQYQLSRNKPPKEFPVIQNLIDSKIVIVENEKIMKALNKFILGLTWEKYDNIIFQTPYDIRDAISRCFTRNIELHDCIVCTNEFLTIVEKNMVDIKSTYLRYIECTDYNEILIDFFYLIVVQYAYDINHYYYINNHGKQKQYLLETGKDLFIEMDKYVRYNFLNSILIPKIYVSYGKLGIYGEIDLIEKENNCTTIIEIKCTSSISIKYYIQLALYNFCLYQGNHDILSLYCNRFKIINLLTGLEHNFIIKIDPVNMFGILIILAEVGNLKFSDLVLIYDLETTDKIDTANKIYPEITEIAIKKYETEMVLINTLVKPTTYSNTFVQKLTGITPQMLIYRPKINIIRSILQNRMKNFCNCKLLAHNGNRFDHLIMKHYDMLDFDKMCVLDTLQLIPVHLPTTIKLENKSLGYIYQKIFGKTFIAHRAMADVDAIICIMKYLNIRF